MPLSISDGDPAIRYTTSSLDLNPSPESGVDLAKCSNAERGSISVEAFENGVRANLALSHSPFDSHGKRQSHLKTGIDTGMGTQIDGNRNKSVKNIHDAFNKGFTPEGISNLLAKGADPDALDENGQTLLHRLAGMSNAELISHYKDRVVDNQSVDAFSEFHEEPEANTPERKFHINLMKSLFVGGANPNIQDSQQKTPLQIAFDANCSLAVLYYLLGNDADPNVEYVQGVLLLHVLLSLPSTDIQSKEGQSRIAFIKRLLTKYTAYPNYRDQNGNTALQIALEANYPFEIIKLILEKEVALELRRGEKLHEKQRHGENTALWHDFLTKDYRAQDLLDLFKRHFAFQSFNPLNNAQEHQLLQLAKEKGYNDIVRVLREAMQKNWASEIESQYFWGFRWLGSLFYRFRAWWLEI